MAKYFISDTHLGHRPVLGFSRRPFRDIDEHDEVIIDHTNRRVGKRDTLYHCGDFAWHSEAEYRKKFRCKNMVLIRGNHDQNRIKRVFPDVQYMHWTKIADVPTVLCHYPMAYWDRSHYRSYHLYGHCHLQREETLDNAFPGRMAMECGVDAAFNLLGHWGPFSEGEIHDIFKSRPGHDNLKDYHGTPRPAWFESLFGEDLQGEG